MMIAQAQAARGARKSKAGCWRAAPLYRPDEGSPAQLGYLGYLDQIAQRR
jgi:hypothetical protein